MKTSKRGIVGLVRGHNRYDNVFRALEQIADTVDLGHARQVLIKPNFVSTIRQLFSTHVDAMRALLDFLRSQGVGHVVIAEYAGAGAAMDGYRAFDYLPLLDEYDVELVDLAQEDWVDATICSRNLEPIPAKVARRVVESDFRISVAPVKTHNSVIVTLSLKNITMGTLRDRCLFHQGWPAMHLTLYGLAPLTAPHLSVLDGFEGTEGDGPVNGDPVDLQVAIASTDFVAAETIGALVMDHDPQQIGYLVYSHRGGLGEGDPSKIELRGNVSVEEARIHFHKHPTFEDQLGWRTPAADRMVLPGSGGAVDWQPALAVSVPFAEASSECKDMIMFDTPTYDKVEQALVPVTVAIPSGTFIMGEQDRLSVFDGFEGTGDGRYEIDLPTYRIGLHPVTNEEYARFVNDGGYTERWKSYWTEAGWRYVQDYGLTGPRGWEEIDGSRANHPVVGVSWYEAWAYCAWLRAIIGRHFALPSEAQWEKAARGEDGRRYPWGNGWEPQRCNSAEAGLGHTTPVMQCSDGRSPYGIYDMAGNVWEWCSSIHDSYPYRSDDGREDSTRCHVRSVRGGSWFVNHEFVRCAYRNYLPEAFRGDHLGFRVVELLP